MILADFCSKKFTSHVNKLVKDLKAKCDIMVESLEKEFGSIAEFSVPKGGIFIWITLPNSVDTKKLSIISAAKGITINPGSEWVSNPNNGTHKMRLCFANPEIEVITDGIKKLSSLCYEEFGVPEISGNIERNSFFLNLRSIL